MPKPTDHYMLKRYMGNGYISEIAPLDHSYLLHHELLAVCCWLFESQQPTVKETLIQSLSDFTLEFLGIARNNLTRIASYLRKVMTKLCIKILVEADSAIESAFP